MGSDGSTARMRLYGLYASGGLDGTGGTPIMTTSVLVSGDRNWGWFPTGPDADPWNFLRVRQDKNVLYSTMDALAEVWPISRLIHGAAPGADTWSDRWAEDNGIDRDPYPALWEQHDSYDRKCWCPDKTVRKCRGAGPIRNLHMLEHAQPDLVVAFHRNLPASRGTKHMVSIARKAGIPVFVFPDYAYS